MHECPFCGEECYCDMDDCGGLPVPDDCPHVCEEPEHDDFDDIPDEILERYSHHQFRVYYILNIAVIFIAWVTGSFWHTIKIRASRIRVTKPPEGKVKDD